MYVATYPLLLIPLLLLAVAPCVNAEHVNGVYVATYPLLLIPLLLLAVAPCVNAEHVNGVYVATYPLLLIPLLLLAVAPCVNAEHVNGVYVASCSSSPRSNKPCSCLAMVVINKQLVAEIYLQDKLQPPSTWGHLLQPPPSSSAAAAAAAAATGAPMECTSATTTGAAAALTGVAASAATSSTSIAPATTAGGAAGTAAVQHIPPSAAAAGAGAVGGGGGGALVGIQAGFELWLSPQVHTGGMVAAAAGAGGRCESSPAGYTSTTTTSSSSSNSSSSSLQQGHSFGNGADQGRGSHIVGGSRGTGRSGGGGRRGGGSGFRGGWAGVHWAQVHEIIQLGISCNRVRARAVVNTGVAPTGVGDVSQGGAAVGRVEMELRRLKAGGLPVLDLRDCLEMGLKGAVQELAVGGVQQQGQQGASALREQEQQKQQQQWKPHGEQWGRCSQEQQSEHGIWTLLQQQQGKPFHTQQQPKGKQQAGSTREQGQQQQQVQRDLEWAATLVKIQSGMTRSLVKHLASHPSLLNTSSSRSTSRGGLKSSHEGVTVSSDFVTELLKVVVQRLPNIAPHVQLLVLPLVLPERAAKHKQRCSNAAGVCNGSSSGGCGAAGSGSSAKGGGSRRVVTKDGVVRCDGGGGSGNGGGISGPKLLNLNVPFVMQLQQVWEALPRLRLVLVMGGSDVGCSSGTVGDGSALGEAAAGTGLSGDGSYQFSGEALCGVGGPVSMPGLSALGVSGATMQAVRSIVAACLDRLSLPGPADSLD